MRREMGEFVLYYVDQESIGCRVSRALGIEPEEEEEDE
jgi:hypothetical protein